MKIGSLFTGYGGLDMAVENLTGGETVWVSDIDKGASKILTHRYPDTPNHGDITQIDWTTVEPVDILTGGFPCQDLSHAGKRAGLKAGTRSGLWSHMAEAVKNLQPKLVVVENVRGLLSAYAPGDVEPCPWCVGDSATVDLRALGVVLADLADIGYDTQWCGLRAADVGACHGRFRVFLIAYPAGDPWRFGNRDGGNSADPYGIGQERFRGPRQRGTGSTDNGGPDVTLLPTPVCEPDTGNGHARNLGKEARLLPTPVVNDMGSGKTPSEWSEWSEWSEAMRVRHGNGNGHGASLSVEAQRFLPTPTPTTRDHKDHKVRREPHRPESVDTLSRALVDFGPYAEAVRRWADVSGRQAPEPTLPTGKNGNRQLSAHFVEWMMGLPAGWVTNVPGLTRNEALKALGNGVVPQQAEAALSHMLSSLEVPA